MFIRKYFIYPCRYLCHVWHIMRFSISIKNVLYVRFNDKIIPRKGVLEKLIVDLMSFF
jgi:hypothetical protein